MRGAGEVFANDTAGRSVRALFLRHRHRHRRRRAKERAGGEGSGTGYIGEA